MLPIMFMKRKLLFYKLLDKLQRVQWLHTLCLLSLLSIPGFVFAGSKPSVNHDKSLSDSIKITIRGVVRDNQYNVLPGATVKVKGSTTAAITTVDGRYSINVAGKQSVLAFSFVGMATQEVKVDNKTGIDIILQPTSGNLNDVVVIGYGTQKRSDLTGSISSIKSKDLENKQFNNIQETLQGRVAGLQLTTGDATPGSSPNIRIRGTGSLGTDSEPLFVVDGYPSNEDLNSINPGDIASIEVLKDASATAIYGSRGANGVILVTTKRGTPGQLRIDGEVYRGAAQLRKKIKLMNALEYATYRNEVSFYNTPTNLPFASAAQLKNYETNSTDWQDALFDRAPLTNVNLSMSGGDANTRFLISANFFDQKGIVINTGYTRNALRFNFDRTISSKLKFNMITSLTKTLNNRTKVNSSGTNAGVVTSALRMNPTVPIYDASGNFITVNYANSDPDSDPTAAVDLNGNPVAYAYQNVDLTNVFRLQLNTSLSYQIIPSLQLRTFFGVEYTYGGTNAYTPNNLYEQAFYNGTASKSNYLRYNWINETYLTYNKEFNKKNSLNAVLGYSYQMFKNETTGATSTNYFTNAFLYNNLATGVSQNTTSSASQSQLQSVYGRLNAKLFTKLLLTGTLRVDGSSNFGSNHKYAYFPSVGAAYRFGEEKFIKNLGFVDDLKFRAGYGVTGNQSIPSYQSRFGYALASNSVSGSSNPGKSVFGSTNQVAVAASRAENPDLQWEQTAAVNFGVDLTMLRGRLSLSAEAYQRVTKKLLFQIVLPSTTGITLAYDNFGQLTNKGIELTLNAIPVKKESFQWNNTLTFAVNRNIINDLGTTNSRVYGYNIGPQGGLLVASNPNWILLEPGLSVGTFRGYTSAGIWQSQREIDESAFNATYKTAQRPGGVKYVDINGDGKIDVSDVTPIGTAYPKFTTGFSNSFTYKQWDLNVFFQGQLGNKILNFNHLYTEYGVASNHSVELLNRWNGEGTSNRYPRAGLEGTRLLDDTFIENGSYLRMRSVSLTYNFKSGGILKKIMAKNLRLYATATNLLTITKYSGYDPEVGSFNYNPFTPGVDYGAFPTAKSLIIGLKAGF
jgi:TonB-linked SusC/RagA family outer membrane protein